MVAQFLSKLTFHFFLILDYAVDYAKKTRYLGPLKCHTMLKSLLRSKEVQHFDNFNFRPSASLLRQENSVQLNEWASISKIVAFRRPR